MAEPSPAFEPGSGAALAEATERRMTKAGIVANAIGVAVSFFFIGLLIPIEFVRDDRLALILNGVGMVITLAATFPTAVRIGKRRSGPMNAWLRSDREADQLERVMVLERPQELTIVAGAMWLIAAVVFAAINIPFDVGNGITIFLTILFAGITTVSLGYLLNERVMRPVTARALAGETPVQAVGPGVRARITATWATATGVPVLGIAGIAAGDLLGLDFDRDAVILAVLFLAFVAIAAGFAGVVGVSRSVAGPLESVREALDRVQAGDFEARVVVEDGSEVGLVAAGFNQMAGGLAERERLHDLFGRHVGREVAEAALESGISLGGEEREVAALFVDLVGSTRLASEGSPTAVVALLNRFFTLVVAVAERHDGWVNKFEGDGALCVFGAPVAHPDQAGAALGAARELASRLRDELPELRAAIGVSTGLAVAGNVGTEERFEFTVIGDPVNEAARLCELAKERDGLLLASGRALDAVGEAAERAHWEVIGEEVLRGRRDATQLAVPSGPVSV